MGRGRPNICAIPLIGDGHSDGRTIWCPTPCGEVMDKPGMSQRKRGPLSLLLNEGQLCSCAVLTENSNIGACKSGAGGRRWGYSAKSTIPVPREKCGCVDARNFVPQACSKYKITLNFMFLG